MKVLPLRGELMSWISPPSSRDSSRLMARPRPVPPYLRLVRAVRLLERLEHDLLLVGRDADAGVADVEGNRLAPAWRDEFTMLDVQRHLAAGRELEGVGQQVLEDLLQALGVGDHRLGQARIELDEEIEVLRFRDVAERALAVVVQVVEAQLAHVDHDGARFDLRQVENVVDERQQVVAGRVDRLGELHLLPERLPSLFWQSWSDRISRLFSGVRSSCDMLARNSDL